MAQVEVLDPDRLAILHAQFVGTLCIDVDAHIFEHRQCLSEGERLILAEDHEMHVPRLDPDRFVELDRTTLPGLEHLVDRADVAAGVARVGIFLVARRKHVAVNAEQLVAFVIPERLAHFVAELVRPADDDCRDAAFDVMDADAGPFAGGCPDDRVKPREWRIGYLHARIDGRSVKRFFEHPLDPAAHGRRIAFAWHEYETREEAAEGIAAQEEPDPLAVL